MLDAKACMKAMRWRMGPSGVGLQGASSPSIAARWTHPKPAPHGDSATPPSHAI